ncbi:hypothetical protein CXG81DRAFT_29349 [Caulochytrium protostelioides]|uniref:Gfo/Idh/MocA-like oxidoreductase N-terminal domain-containing protein n=1 Tax=Caulochytrium protostelioides TaxID=1555241 RepID=A0A4P9XCM2_9FUNG|nr:hypothetical protein CXG81DRAFT_29349 [Caulochytrium protostelioides]|eukprot:RKP03185.1 hypothetical protein CXG81DRAFT_29349 [Caulochytrium protostelioides]
MGVLMVGTGEYTTGYMPNVRADSKSDKKMGVVGLVLFDMRRRGHVVGRLAMVGTSGTKNAAIRAHMKEQLADRYCGMDTTVDIYPPDGSPRNPEAYKDAIKSMNPGDTAIIFTPDDTHFTIAMAAIEHGMHVLLAKPAVKTRDEHRRLVEAAARAGVLVAIEFHKRFDPIYADARHRIREALGPMAWFNSYMSQPQYQLHAFRDWAGTQSDISYYLNSHHIDFHCWAMQGRARPLSVVAMAGAGIAETPEIGCAPGTEDTISLLVQWETLTAPRHRAIANYTASWVAAAGEVHSQQRFHYMGAGGEVHVDQAHRGFTMTDAALGFRHVNPLYLRTTPNEHGEYVGQHTYGHMSIEKFVEAAHSVNASHDGPHGSMRAEHVAARCAAIQRYDGTLATVAATEVVTAILEAGRRSLDNGSCVVMLDQ